MLLAGELGMRELGLPGSAELGTAGGDARLPEDLRDARGRVAATVSLHPIGFVCHLDAEGVARVRAQSRMVSVAGSPSRWPLSSES